MSRDFKGVWIPKELWLSLELSPIEKFFLIEIDSLDNDQGCFASNNHFSNLFGISRNRSSEIVKALKEKKYIKIQLIYKGKMVDKRIIKIVKHLNQPSSKPNKKVVGKSTTHTSKPNKKVVEIPNRGGRKTEGGSRKTGKVIIPINNTNKDIKNSVRFME